MSGSGDISNGILAVDTAHDSPSSLATSGNEKDNGSASIGAVVHTFNKFFADFVVFLKESDPDAKAKLKPHYKIIDNLSKTLEHIDDFSTGVPMQVLLEETVHPANEALLALRPAKGITVEEIAKTPSAFWSAMSYVYILGIVLHVYREHALSLSSERKDDLLTRLLHSVLRRVSRIQQQGRQQMAAEEDDEMEIMDDDLLRLLDALDGCEKEARAARMRSVAEGGSVPGSQTQTEHEGVGDCSDKLEELLRTSKIGQLAKELTEDLDLNAADLANLTKQQDGQRQGGQGTPGTPGTSTIPGLESLMDNSGFLGNVMSKMNTKVQEKLRSGEMQPADIFEEAKKVFGLLNLNGPDGSPALDNPMLGNLMSEMAKHFGGGGASSSGAAGAGGKGSRVHVNPERMRNVSARERLAKRLADRNQKKNDGGNNVIVPPPPPS